MLSQGMENDMMKTNVYFQDDNTLVITATMAQAVQVTDEVLQQATQAFDTSFGQQIADGNLSVKTIMQKTGVNPFSIKITVFTSDGVVLYDRTITEADG